jgi:hypothetical protein
MHAESRRTYDDLLPKLLAGETVRVTPENSVKIAKAIRALTPDELQAIDPFKLLKSLLAAHDEKPDHALYSQIRLTASFVDEALFGRQLPD